MLSTGQIRTAWGFSSPPMLFCPFPFWLIFFLVFPVVTSIFGCLEPPPPQLDGPDWGFQCQRHSSSMGGSLMHLFLTSSLSPSHFVPFYFVPFMGGALLTCLAPLPFGPFICLPPYQGGTFLAFSLLGFASGPPPFPFPFGHSICWLLSRGAFVMTTYVGTLE